VPRFGAGPRGFGARKGFWTEPFVLLLVAEKPSHGYELASRLSEFGILINGVGQMGNLYRLLSQLESLGLVAVDWDTSNPGPARKVYKITRGGLNVLQNYAEEASSLKLFIDKFLQRYSNLG